MGGMRDFGAIVVLTMENSDIWGLRVHYLDQLYLGFGCQVSGFRKKFDHWGKGAHKTIFLSPALTISYTPY